MNRGGLRGCLGVLGAAFEMTLRQNVFDGFILFTIIIQPLVIALLALWILKGRAEGTGIFVVVGSGLTGLWSSLLFVSGHGLSHERHHGTLEYLVGVPAPLPLIVFGKTLASVFQSLLSMIAAYTLASLIFGYPLAIGRPWLFALSAILALFSFVCLGLLIAPLFLLNPGIQAWQNAMEFPMYILAGFLFPIALLPGWTTPLSYLLSPYWAALALHGTSSRDLPWPGLLSAWGMTLLLGLFYLALAGLLFRRVSFQARARGTLGLQ